MIDLQNCKLVIGQDPVLNTPAEKFDFANPPVDPVELAKKMIDTMLEHRGYGLSACQIGLPYSVFVMRGEPMFACFNPRIVAVSNETIELDEGCLSFPGMILKKNRPRHLRLRYTMANGETVTNQFTGMSARVVQHEMDHLQGKLLFDDLPWFRKEKLLKKFNKERKNVKAQKSSQDSFFLDLEYAANVLNLERKVKSGSR